MKAEAHRSKALRIERSLARLADSDYEAVIEAAMLAGTHWFNILLHRAQLLPETRDAMHAEFLPLGERRRVAAALPDVLAALDTIERLRTLHVRGDMAGGEGAAQSARECLERLRRAATERES